jgi:serine/threonine protein kinase
LPRVDDFGSYTLVRELGSGSAARVYEARRGDESVALKVFDLGKSRDQVVVLDQFNNEVAVIRRLDHPNIVKVLDAGVVEHQPFIAMELLDHGSLEDRLRSGNLLGADELSTILSQVAEAVDYAHRQKVLHRDIKPSNLLFGDHNRPVLSDFSVAKFIPPRDSRSTRVGIDPPGTTDFLAPEVLSEAPHSTASDLYSLGMTVYYALCGQLPTNGITLFTRSRDRVEDHLIPLCDRNPAISQQVSDVVMKGLARHPRDRFGSAIDFSRAFGLAVSERATTSQIRSTRAQETNTGAGHAWLEYWRYVIVPVLVALIGAVAAWCRGAKP